MHNTPLPQWFDRAGSCVGFHRCTALIITTRDKIIFAGPYGKAKKNLLVFAVVLVDFVV